jgi:anhydro-N-acetylmuramic acid kinase
VNKLKSLISKKELLIAGLMSGTSADGIDVCIVKIKEKKNDLDIKLLGFKTYEYPSLIREKIFELSKNAELGLDNLVRLNMLLGEEFSEAVIGLCGKLKINIQKIDLIGSHGQTIRHLPQITNFCGKEIKGTLQIAEPSVIANKTGITTVGDFRLADMAVGGEGAPLCPLAHYCLFKDKNFSRGILNIGGMVNLTVLPRKCKTEDVFAFDTGPGNMPIDALMTKLYNRKYDKNGKIAFRGKVNQALLKKLKGNNFFKKKPPKSTGREDFEKDLKHILSAKKIPREDIIATVSELTCWAIFDSFKKWVKPKCKIDQLVVCGGGARNRYINKRLSELFYPVKVISSDKLGMDADQVEAICFAILAYLTIKGKAGNLTKATGAIKEVILGKICLA